jgi:hypothetical protein
MSVHDMTKQSIPQRILDDHLPIVDGNTILVIHSKGQSCNINGTEGVSISQFAPPAFDSGL